MVEYPSTCLSQLCSRPRSWWRSGRAHSRSRAAELRQGAKVISEFPGKSTKQQGTITKGLFINMHSTRMQSGHIYSVVKFKAKVRTSIIQPSKVPAAHSTTACCTVSYPVGSLYSQQPMGFLVLSIQESNQVHCLPIRATWSCLGNSCGSSGLLCPQPQT